MKLSLIDVRVLFTLVEEEKLKLEKHIEDDYVKEHYEILDNLSKVFGGIIERELEEMMKEGF